MGVEGLSLNDDGAKALRAGDLPRALEQLTRAVASSSGDDVRPLLNRAECQLQMGRAAAALADADAAVARRPRNALAHVLRGRALLALCRYDTAASAFDVALGIDPENAGARDGLAAVASARGAGADERERGNAAFARRDFGAAVRHYTAALAAKLPAEKRAVLLSNRSAAHLSLQDVKAALADATQASTLRPSWPKAHTRLGAARLASGDAAGARDAYAAAAALDPASAAAREGLASASEALAAEGTKAAADAAFKAGDFGAAESGYAAALRGITAGTEAAAVLHSNRSASLARLGRWPEALTAAREALRLRPSWPRAWARVAAALHGGGDAEAAYALAADGLRGACAGSAEVRTARDSALEAFVAGATTACAARLRRFTDAPVGVLRAASGRVFCTSDVHVDQHGNHAWCKAVSDTAFQRDTLLVAGDMGDTLNALKIGLRCLKSKFKRVIFTPGNHDLWVRPELEGKQYADAVCKLAAVMALCDSLGVDTGPVRLADDVTIVPLLSWYNAAFDEADPRPGGLRYDKFSTWPCTDADVWRLMQRFNAPRVAAVVAAASAAPPRKPGSPSPVIITASHFLPRAELQVPFGVPEIAKAVGCKELDLQIAELNAAVHVFGHTHLNGDGVAGARYVRGRDGRLEPTGARNETRYVQAALEGGAPGFYCIFDASTGLTGRYHSHTTGAPC